MKTRLIDGIEVHRGSGYVFADLGLPDADKLKIKTGLVIEIRKDTRELGLTQLAAAKRMGITQPKGSDMMRGDFTNLSERKLMDCLTRLGYSRTCVIFRATHGKMHSRQLDRLQRGKQPDDFKPMPIVGKGVEEIRVWDDAGTFRVIYTARLANAVCVLHAFLEKDTGHIEAGHRNRKSAIHLADER